MSSSKLVSSSAILNEVLRIHIRSTLDITVICIEGLYFICAYMTNDDYTSFVKESMLNNYPYMTNLVLLFADHTADNEPKMTLRVVRRRLRNVLRLGRLFLAMMCSTVLICGKQGRF